MTSEARRSLTGASVLVVEDDPASARLLAMVLRGAGCQVVVASTATEATKLIFGGLRPAIVLLDLDLPDLSGMDLAKVLRSIPETHDLPIVAVSASGLAFGEKAALSAGCDGFMRKPIDVETFPQTVAGYLDSRRARPKRTSSPVTQVLKGSHETILGAVPKAICVVRADDLTVVYANRKFQQVIGYTPEEVIGRPMTVVDAGAHPGSMRDAIAQQLDSHGEGTFELPGLRDDKPDFWVQVSVTRLPDPDLGELWLLVLDDISARKRAEEELQRAFVRSESRFAALSDAGVIAIVTGKIDGAVHDANDVFLRLVGWTREDVVAGKLHERDFAPQDLRQRDDAAAMARAGGVPAPYETEYVRRDGTRVPVLVGGTLLDASSYLAFAIDLTEKRHHESALRDSQRRFDALWRSGIVGIVVADNQGKILEANDAYLATVGYTREDLAAGGIDYAQLTPADRQGEIVRATEQMAAHGFAEPWETEAFRKDGSRVPIMVGVAAVDDRHNLAITNDLTSRKHAEDRLRRTEEQLRQSQKMDAVGRLAGGVAHDFNNMLSVMISYSELLIGDLSPNDPMRDDLDEIRKAAMRAAELTKQLLIFSRQQVVDPRVLNVNEIVVGMDKMLQRLLGEDIELAAVPAAELGRIRADASHLEQVVMNLAVNARDAMPDGGKLTIETCNVDLDEAFASTHVPMLPGRYVMLAVSDTGCGMDRQTLARIFDPFFTTKPVGKGTGLGLSTVFGIVQQSAGYIWVYSEPGRGTTFKLYFPRVDAAAQELVRPATPVSLRGTETVLLVEDEDQVRRVALGILERHGYQVLVASNAGEAIQICETHAGPIDLLLTDVVMPGMSGPELARRAVLLRGELRVLCVSGYTDDSVVRHGVLDGKIPFLQKPLTPDGLARKIREVLDARPQDAT